MQYRTGSQQLMKDWNLSLLANLIRKNPKISRAELTALTNLSPTTVSSLVAELIDDGLVRETGVRDSQSGRKPILLEFVPEGRIGIGVSINHDGIKVALVNLLGEPLYIFEGRASLEHEKAVLAQVEQGIEECIAHAKEQNLQDRIYGIGIGVLGLVEGTKSRYLLGNTWHSIDLAPIVEKHPKFYFSIENDINAMALGEVWFGQGKEAKHLLYVYLGYGLGVGVIIDGKLYRGAFGSAGELGHVSVSHGDFKCRCGLTGCLGVIADGAHVMLRIKRAIEEGTSTSISPDNLTFESFLDAAKTGDPFCNELLDELISNLSRAIISAVNLFDPGLVIIGGFFSDPKHPASSRLISTIQNNSLASYRDDFRILASNFGDNSGVIGAAAAVLKNVFDLQLTQEQIS